MEAVCYTIKTVGSGDIFLIGFIHCTNTNLSGALVNNLSAVKYRQIEERAAEVAHYIVDNNATVRQAAKAFGISKSTIHAEVTKRNGYEVR